MSIVLNMLTVLMSIDGPSLNFVALYLTLKNACETARLIDIANYLGVSEVPVTSVVRKFLCSSK